MVQWHWRYPRFCWPVCYLFICLNPWYMFSIVILYCFLLMWQCLFISVCSLRIYLKLKHDKATYQQDNCLCNWSDSFNNVALAESIPTNISNVPTAKELHTILLISLNCQLIKLILNKYYVVRSWLVQIYSNWPTFCLST